MGQVIYPARFLNPERYVIEAQPSAVTQHAWNWMKLWGAAWEPYLHVLEEVSRAMAENP